MARFNTRAARARPTSRVTSTGRVLRTFEGGRGHERDARSELFLLSVSDFVSQRTFYETGADRADRFARLVRELAVTDPEWTAGLLGWLRGEGNLRTASIVGAAEYVKARLDAGATDGPANCSRTGRRGTAETSRSPSSAASPTPCAVSTAARRC